MRWSLACQSTSFSSTGSFMTLSRLFVELLEQAAQFERRTKTAVAKARSDGIGSAIDDPARDLRCVSTRRTSFTGHAALALRRDHLPASAGANTRIIPPGDKRGAVARNHIVGNVVCFGVECSTDTLRQCFNDYGFARLEDLVVEFGQSVREHVAGESRSCMSRISRWLCHAPDPSWSLPASTRRCARCSS